MRRQEIRKFFAVDRACSVLVRKPTVASYMPLSIGICSYNRCDQLRVTLQALVDQRSTLVQGDQILLVDNNSSDRTREVVEEYLHQLPLQYVFEQQQGLSAARNAALRKFSRTAIVFLDDDITLGANTLSEYRRALEGYPNCGFFGGKISVDWQGKKPSWLRSESMPLLSGLIGYFDPIDDGQLCTSIGSMPYGANFLLTGELVKAVGEFDTSLGVRGTSIGRGEETDYFLRAVELGYRGRYLAGAEVQHRFQTERLNSKYLFSYGIQKGLLQESSGSALRCYLRALDFAIRSLIQLFKGRKDNYYQCIINIGIEIGRFRASR